MIALIVCGVIMLALQAATGHWWWIMIVAFANGAAVARSGGRALWTGGLAAGLLWAGAAAYFYLDGGRIITARMARLFGLGGAWTMIPLTALVAVSAAGLSGYAGFAVRALIKKPIAKEPS